MSYLMASLLFQCREEEEKYGKRQLSQKGRLEETANHIDFMDNKKKKSMKDASTKELSQNLSSEERQKEKIRELRERLTELVRKKGSFLDPEVLTLSEQLDRLLLGHMKRRYNHRDETDSQ